ncbi:MAG: hypothetical protein SCALA702_33910 [Melioribacteraceae bacterium]|nr:MAG: hypothetical protein SCALA702_33910 [Melioribacteraceae bacterium]
MQYKFALTFDIDWAPDEVIHFLVDILVKNGLKATFFCTHKTPVLENLPAEFERAIHPNFRNSFNYREKIDELLQIIPEAKGIRSHGLLSSTNILLQAKEAGLVYESNSFMPAYKGLYVTEKFNNFFMVPYNYSDSHALINGVHKVYSMEDLENPGLKIFTFHPIHIFLNTKDEAHYDSIRSIYKDAAKLKNEIYDGEGIRTRFIELLQYLKDYKVKTYTCSQLIENRE